MVGETEIAAKHLDIRRATTDRNHRRIDAVRRQQAIAQTLDHEYIVPQPVLGGELSVTTNLSNIDRDLAASYTVKVVETTAPVDVAVLHTLQLRGL